MVDKNDCLLWAGPKYGSGHGQMYIGWKDGKNITRGAHVVLYELEHGDVPVGLELDHLCETPPCINPDHLEPVPHRENTRRHYQNRTHCNKGHEFMEANICWKRKKSNVSPSNPTGLSRYCRTCMKGSNRKARLNKRLTPSC